MPLTIHPVVMRLWLNAYCRDRTETDLIHVTRPERPVYNQPMQNNNNDTTHFGYETVPAAEKAGRVREVFDSVASSYDLMNDLMSLGTHRAWKAFALAVVGYAIYAASSTALAEMMKRLIDGIQNPDAAFRLMLPLPEPFA